MIMQIWKQLFIVNLMILGTLNGMASTRGSLRNKPAAGWKMKPATASEIPNPLRVGLFSYKSPLRLSTTNLPTTSHLALLSSYAQKGNYSAHGKWPLLSAIAITAGSGVAVAVSEDTKKEEAGIVNPDEELKKLLARCTTKTSMGNLRFEIESNPSLRNTIEKNKKLFAIQFLKHIKEKNLNNQEMPEDWFLDIILEEESIKEYLEIYLNKFYNWENINPFLMKKIEENTALQKLIANYIRLRTTREMRCPMLASELINILCSNPKVTKILFQPISKTYENSFTNLETLIKRVSKHVLWHFEKIPVLSEKLAYCIASTIENENIPNFEIYELQAFDDLLNICQNSQSFEIIKKMVNEHFDYLFNISLNNKSPIKYTIHNFIKNILKTDLTIARSFCRKILEKYNHENYTAHPDIFDSHIYELIKLNDPLINKDLYNFVLNNFSYVSKNDYLFHFIYKYLQTSIEVQNTFIEKIENDPQLFARHDNLLLLINEILYGNEEFKDRFLNIVKNNINEFSPLAFCIAAVHKPGNEDLKNKLNSLPPTFQTILKIAAYEEADKNNETINTYLATPTLIHFKNMTSSILTHVRLRKRLKMENLIKVERDSIFIKYLIENLLYDQFLLKKPEIDHMIGQIICKEKELSQNYYTFVHGQRREYLPFEQLHNYLNNLTQESVNEEFLPLHVKEHINDLENEKKLRKRLLANGRNYSDKDYQHILCVNWAYLANSSLRGSSTAYYIKKNKNELGKEYINYSKIFEKFGISIIYKKYRDELQELQDSFVKLSKQGVCILIAIPKATINKHVYVAKTAGLKKTVTIEGLGRTEDVRTIMEVLTQYPEKIDNSDQIEFCIPMTYDKNGGLNPASGIKVFPFDSADPQKLKEWEQRRDELFERIAQDIKYLQKKENSEVLEYMYILS